jgi:hypothetical protein
MRPYFSTPPIFSAPVQSIDRDNGIIRGVTIAQVGPAKGHGGFVDKTFLLQLVDNATSKSAGIKARFGHPNMCATALGTYLGRFKNFSYANNKVNADLYLDTTARNAPGGDLYSYVLDMAERNPDMFGASIVFEIAESVFLIEDMDGTKVKNEYFRLKELRATDIVDEPAATDGLFSAVRMSGVESFPGIATQFLDENPQILELIAAKPDSLIEFLSNYLTNTKMKIPLKVKQGFTTFLDILNSPIYTGIVDDSNLDRVFDEARAIQPDSFTAMDEPSQVQKADILIKAFSLLNEKLLNAASVDKATETNIEQLNQKYQELNTSSEKITAELNTSQIELQDAKTQIQLLTEQLSARPSIPLNVTDPKVSVFPSEKDLTGKQVLSNIPSDLKRKLKN